MKNIDYYCPYCYGLVVEPNEAGKTIKSLTNYCKKHKEVNFVEANSGNIQLFHYTCYKNSLNVPF